MLIEKDHNVFLTFYHILDVLYHFELQMAGIILLSAMAAGGLSLWLKRRKERKILEQSAKESEDALNYDSSVN